MSLRLASPGIPALLVLLLVSAPPAAAHAPPDVDEWSFTGTIGCSFAYGLIQTTDLCAPRDPNDHELVIHPHLSAVAVWLDPKASPLEMPLDLLWGGPFNLTKTSGDGVLHIQNVDPDASPAWHHTIIGHISVRAAWDEAQPNIALLQHYRVCLGLFYDDAPVPDDYHPCPEEVE